jgi:hypothetical protein
MVGGGRGGIPRTSIASALQLSTFDKEFMVECAASGSVFGAVLHQGNNVVAFFGRPIASKHAKLAAYERKLSKLSSIDTRISRDAPSLSAHITTTLSSSLTSNSTIPQH